MTQDHISERGGKMKATTKLREKYGRRGKFTPAGARDVRSLCDAVDTLVSLSQEIVMSGIMAEDSRMHYRRHVQAVIDVLAARVGADAVEDQDQ